MNISLLGHSTPKRVLALGTTLTALSLQLFFGSFQGAASAAPAAESSRYYASTGHTISGAFLQFFDAHGGVRLFGYPLSDQVTENGRPVQYFERERFEYHREASGTQFEVQLGLLGVQAAQGKIALTQVQPFQPKAAQIFVSATRHSLGGAFLDFWRANGDVRILGYPISEPTQQGTLTIQYFERARMEYHPESAARGYGVQLGLLGKEYIASHPSLASALTRTVSSQPAPAAPTHQLNGMEKDLFDRINGARQGAGLASVAVDGRISNIALYRSNDMATKGYFSHTPSDGTNFTTLLKANSIGYHWAGEIIAMNNYDDGQSAAQAFNGFMNSPAHKAIIMDPRYTSAGVGQARAADGTYYYTAVFVQP